MFYISRLKWLLVLVIANALVVGCSKGVTSGTLSTKFAGVQNAEVLSPTQVRLHWLRSQDDIDYTVYVAGKSEPLKVLTFESYTVDNLEPNTTYKFKVVAKTTSGSIGDDKEIIVTTWPRFDGLKKLTKDENGNFILQWDYPYAVKNFHIFYLTEQVPTALNTNSWAQANATTTAIEITIKDWIGAANYYFTVHAEYASGEFERPNIVMDSLANPNFPTASIEISVPTLTIGSLPVVAVTPHQPDVLNDFPLANYSSQLYQGDTPISDPQSGIANLVVLPNANLTLGIVDNLNVRVNYKDASINQTLIKRGYSTIIKDQAKIFETPPVDATVGGPGFLGKTLATGDFNCDGTDDLAVGMPDSSIAALGQTAAYAGVVYIYYSKPFSCGSGCNEYKLYTPALGAPAPAVAPIVRGQDPQVIAIADLPVKSQFGSSLAKGNLNGDGVGSPFKACEDLLVGAPGMQPDYDPAVVYTDGGAGSAFVFFGSSEGLNSSTSLTVISENSGTCLGNYLGDSCSPVRIWPDQINYQMAEHLANTASKVDTGLTWSFGSAVSFIGDINADGYQDIAIGAPYEDWDGRTDDGQSTTESVLQDAGSVHIYFGSKRGLGFAQIEKVDTANGYVFNCTSNTQKGCVRAVRVFSPLPQIYQNFGFSIAGGVDLDGSEGPQDLIYPTIAEKTSKCTTARPNLCYSASDFVIGAPGGSLFKPTGTMGFSSFSSNPGSIRYVAPVDSGIIGDTDWLSSPIPWNIAGDPFVFGSDNFSMMGRAAGLAFVYFGINKIDISGTAPVANLSNYFSCSNRYDLGNLGPYSPTAAVLPHFSCFTNGKNIRYLYPRDSSTAGFGRSVAALGGSHKKFYSEDPANAGTWKWEDVNRLTIVNGYTAATNFYEAYTDTNDDGFGEVFVGAPYTTGNSSSNAGAAWGYFGNLMREYDLAGLKAKLGSVSSANYYQTVNPNCRSFDNDPTGNPSGADDRKQCKPVLIKLNSFGAGGLFGYDNKAISKGDVNGDGLEDLVVGAPYDPTGGPESGLVYIFTSVSPKTSSVSGGIGPSNYKVSKSGVTGTRFGSAVATGRFEDPTNKTNINGKPYVSVVVGAPNDYAIKPGGGAVHLYKTNYNTFVGGSSPTESITETQTSYQDLKYQSTRIVGDINNDGFDDAVGHISYYNTKGERVYQGVVYFGARIGLISPDFCKGNKDRIFATGSSDLECVPKAIRTSSVKTLNNILLPQLLNAPNGVINGWAMFQQGVGDVNQDGFDDVIFANPFEVSSGKGNITLYFGSSNGLNNVNSPSFSPVSVGDPQIVTGGYKFNIPSDYYIAQNLIYNRDLMAHGDFNGDGYQDIVITDPDSLAPSPTDPWNCTAVDIYCPYAQISQFGRLFILYGSSLGYQTPRLKDPLKADLFPLGTASNSWVDAAGTFFDPYEPMPSTYPGKSSERFDETNPIAGAYACELSNCKPTVIWNPINIFEYTNLGTYGTNLPSAYSHFSHRFGQSIVVIKPTAGKEEDSKYDSLVVGAPEFREIPCAASSATSTSISGRAYVFYGSIKGLRAFNRKEYYNPDPTSTGGCWASPEAADTNLVIIDPNVTGPGKDLVAHARDAASDTPKRILAIQPPIPNNKTAANFNGKSRRFGHRMSVAGDLNGDGVEDIVISNRMESSFLYDVATNLITYNGTDNFYGQGWVYYGSLCNADNEKLTWTNNDDPLNPKLSDFATQTEFLARSPARTLSDSCFKNASAKKYLPHTFSVPGTSNSNGDYFFSAIVSGRAGNSNFNADGIDNYDDVLIGSQNSDDATNSANGLGNGVVFFGSSLGLIVNELPQTFMSQIVGSTLLSPKYKPFKIVPIFKNTNANFFSGAASKGDVNGDKAMDFMIPSATFSGTVTNRGVDLGAFMLFY